MTRTVALFSDLLTVSNLEGLNLAGLDLAGSRADVRSLSDGDRCRNLRFEVSSHSRRSGPPNGVVGTNKAGPGRSDDGESLRPGPAGTLVLHHASSTASGASESGRRDPHRHVTAPMRRPGPAPRALK